MAKTGQNDEQDKMLEMSKLNQEIGLLNNQFKDLLFENRKKQRMIQDENEALDKAIEDLLQTFDQRVEELQTKIESMSIAYESETEQLRRLEGLYPELKLDYDKVLEQQKLKQKEKSKVEAAVIIQTWWRECCKQKIITKTKTNTAENKKPKKAKTMKK
ncbi:dynein regulatory complex protein 10 [Nothobranchius furzeri]|uniref:dynein regulatory complex protein 10 n=1 Tax=Nothobranchius furzeri TaxID=105023 RepID=UPI00077D64B4